MTALHPATISCLLCLDTGKLHALGVKTEQPCPECPRGDWFDEYEGWLAPFEQMLAHIADEAGAA